MEVPCRAVIFLLFFPGNPCFPFPAFLTFQPSLPQLHHAWGSAWGAEKWGFTPEQAADGGWGRGNGPAFGPGQGTDVNTPFHILPSSLYGKRGFAWLPIIITLIPDTKKELQMLKGQGKRNPLHAGVRPPLLRGSQSKNCLWNKTKVPPKCIILPYTAIQILTLCPIWQIWSTLIETQAWSLSFLKCQNNKNISISIVGKRKWKHTEIMVEPALNPNSLNSQLSISAINPIMLIFSNTCAHIHAHWN